MSYVDGYVLNVSKKRIGEYRKLATNAGKVWKDHGALQYVECVGDDLAVKFGLPFTKLAKPKSSETVVFAFIVYKSRKHRDQVNAKVMKDKRMQCPTDPKDMPFDFKKMTWGGFKAIVEY